MLFPVSSTFETAGMYKNGCNLTPPTLCMRGMRYYYGKCTSTHIYIYHTSSNLYAMIVSCSNKYLQIVLTSMYVPTTQWCNWSIKLLTGVSNLEHFLTSLMDISAATLSISLPLFLRKKMIYSSLFPWLNNVC